MSFNTAGDRVNSKGPASDENRARGFNLTINTNIPFNPKLNGEASSFKPRKSNNQFLLRGSTPDDGPLIVSTEKHAANMARAKSMPMPIGTNNGISPTLAKVIYTTDVVPGKFLGSHFVKLVVSNDAYDGLFKEMDCAYDWSRLTRSFFVMPESEGKKMTAYVVFDDVRRAATARDNVELVETTADVDYITQPELAAAQKVILATQPQNAGPLSYFYDGQVMFFAKFDGHVTACKADGLEDQIRGLAQKFGEVLALGELDAKNGMARFRVEFYSIKAAKEVVKKVTAANPVDLGGWLVSAQELPDINSAATSETGTGTGTAGRVSPIGSADGSSPTYVSPTGRTAWCFDKATGEITPAANNASDVVPAGNGNALMMQPTRQYTPPMQLQCGGPQQQGPRHGPLAHPSYSQGGYPYPHQQQHTAGLPYGRGRNDFGDRSQIVDIETVRLGHDVRTTLMLRNLPNQMDYHKLKEILNASNFGEYDFSYVRIDYKKGMSVGYGFVNFSDPAAIVKFLEHHAGRPWMPELSNRRGAARLAEVSYATVQGYDCCVEKFRNSSVMTEFVDYRPKLWYTAATAPEAKMIGQERDFPPVNNVTKHQRSLANATQIGLFPPQSRRGPAGQYRAIRSQYDRGTTAQQQEDLVHQLQQQLHQVQLVQAGQFYGCGGHPINAAQANHSMPPMMPIPQQQAPFGAVVPYHAHGRPAFPHAGPVMAPNNFYGQMPMSMAPVPPQNMAFVLPQNVAPMPPQNVAAAPPQQQQHMHANDLRGTPAADPRYMGRGHPVTTHATSVPRSLTESEYEYEYECDYDDEDPNAFEGDVDVAKLMGYVNPTQQKSEK